MPPATYFFRKKITIDHNQVEGVGDLTDFPVLISHTDLSLRTTSNGGKVTSSSGYDIIFTSTSDTVLKHEVVFWSATTGQIIAWVKIPTLDGDANTEIYIRYGNSLVTSATQDPTNVWDSNYKGVWHMTQDPSGTAPQILDSTSNGYHMTMNGSMTSGDLVTGQIYKGIDFDGTDDYLISTAWSSIISGNDPRTMEAWYSTTSTADATWYGWGAASSNNLSSLGVFSSSAGYLGFGNDYTGALTSSGVWTYIAFSNRSDLILLKRNASSEISGGVGATLNTSSSADLYFGRYVGGGYATVKLEEIRISNIARSNEWLVTSYNTAKNPSTFYSLGPEETTGISAWLKA